MSRRTECKRRARDRSEARKYERRMSGWHLRWTHMVERRVFRTWLDEVFDSLNERHNA
jgi:hypothetical protein